MRRVALLAAFAAAATLGLSLDLSWGLSLPWAGAAQASPEPDAVGVWDRDDGRGGVKIFPCGDVLCGTIVWLREKNTPAYVGQTVLFDMKQTARNTWAGSAHNPEDGRDYSGTLTVDGDKLLTRGCVLAGLICQSVALTRAR